MLVNLKRQWRTLREAPPGTRFKRRYERRQKTGRSGLAKPLYLGAGVVIFLAGLVLLPAPGPGLIVVAIGATLMAQESYFVAWTLDWLELRARAMWKWGSRAWRHIPLAVRGLLVASAVIAAGLAGWGAYALLFT